MRRRLFRGALVLAAVLLPCTIALAFNGSTVIWGTAFQTINDTHSDYLAAWPFVDAWQDGVLTYLEVTWENAPGGEQSAAITVNGSVSVASDTSPYPFVSGPVTFVLWWSDCNNQAHQGALHRIWVAADRHSQVAFTEVIRDWCPATASNPWVMIKWEATPGNEAVVDQNDAYLMSWASN